MYGQINDLELILSNYDFVRTHQNFLVNLVHIEKKITICYTCQTVLKFP